MDPAAAAAVAVLAAVGAALLALGGWLGWRHRGYRRAVRPHDFAGELARLGDDSTLDPAARQMVSPAELDRSSLRIDSKLGAGEFGELWRGGWAAGEGAAQTKPVAIRRVKTGRFVHGRAGSPPSFARWLLGRRAADDPAGGIAIEETEQALLEEAALLAQVPAHPNVAGLHGVVTAGSPRLLVLTYCANGSLLDLLRAVTLGGGPRLWLSRAQRLAFGLDIARGMEHLARHRIVHRNLAALRQRSPLFPNPGS